MTDTTDPTEIQEWVYAGRRLNSKGKPVDAWVTEAGKGKQVHFGAGTKLSTHIIGALYRAKVEVEGDTMTLYGVPTFVEGMHAPEADRREWTALDSVTNTKLAAERRERNAAKVEALDEALKPLVEIAKTLRSRADQDAFLATVIRRLTTAAW